MHIFALGLYSRAHQYRLHVAGQPLLSSAGEEAHLKGPAVGTAVGTAAA